MTEQTAPPLTVGPLTLTDLVRYQGASGDFNPIHHDGDAAAKAGLDAVIAPGMLSAGLMSSWLLSWSSRRSVRAFAIRFTAPVRLGDTLTVHGEITAGGDGTVQVAMTCANEQGKVVAKGQATLHRPQGGQ